jgi:hypothetical protein
MPPGPLRVPYSGQFTWTSANGGVSGHQKPFEMQLRLYIPFKIISSTSSGTTTITGTITNPYPWVGGWGLCGSSNSLVGFQVFGYYSHPYTATIQSPNKPVQTISGNAQISGNFYSQPGFSYHPSAST